MVPGGLTRYHRPHAVDAHLAQAHDIFIGAAVNHHADGPDRQQHGKGVPDLVVEAGLSDLVDIEDVGIAQDFQFLRRDLTGEERKARPRKWMPADKNFRQAEFATEHAHLIFEQAVGWISEASPPIFAQ